ncbi:hypothetical protein ILUMI_11298 [Ignelater luminosus]|uniref:Reverse transcriptase domain-containing protein n=1 Tax=Ignelater luminosus TaxID=2038154 RepID=A0A8K0D2D3_IGNLU|nr:hypothetical protein ILUMI_11298 [Ignelater luminosus]
MTRLCRQELTAVLLLNSVDWSFIRSTGDIELATKRFYDILFEGIHKSVSRKIIEIDKYPKWYSPELKKLINLKNKLYKRYKSSKCEDDYKHYAAVRKETKFLIDLCFLCCISSVELTIPTNIKHFWSFINSLRKEKGIPNTMLYENRSLDSPEDILNGFSEYFQSCYKNYHSEPSYSLTAASNLLLSNHSFTVDEREKKILALDSNKNSGPDMIPPLLLKGCCYSLSTPLCELFQLSFNTCCFSEVWKNSNLFPIYKAGDKCDIKNYRGISLVSSIPKLIESIITDELFEITKHLIAEEQHGFFRGRSTTTNLAVFCDFLSNNIETGKRPLTDDKLHQPLEESDDDNLIGLLESDTEDLVETDDELRHLLEESDNDNFIGLLESDTEDLVETDDDVEDEIIETNNDNDSDDNENRQKISS